MQDKNVIINDLKALSIFNSTIEYSRNFDALIEEWVSSKLREGPILATDYILFKRDLFVMLQAEISLIQETGQIGIWLVERILPAEETENKAYSDIQ